MRAVRLLASVQRPSFFDHNGGSATTQWQLLARVTINVIDKINTLRSHIRNDIVIRYLKGAR